MHIFQNKKDMTKDLEKYFDIVKIEGYRIPFKMDSGKVFTFIS